MDRVFATNAEPKEEYREIRCYIRDPDGYIIEVGQSTDLTQGYGFRRAGFTVTDFITVADIDRSADFYERSSAGAFLAEATTRVVGGKDMSRIRSKVGKCFRMKLALHVGA